MFSAIGPTIIDDMKAVSIPSVLIQPGAASPEILQKCSTQACLSISKKKTILVDPHEDMIL